jgi:hypothetical protein
MKKKRDKFYCFALQNFSEEISKNIFFSQLKLYTIIRYWILKVSNLDKGWKKYHLLPNFFASTYAKRGFKMKTKPIFLKS